MDKDAMCKYCEELYETLKEMNRWEAVIYKSIKLDTYLLIVFWVLNLFNCVITVAKDGIHSWTSIIAISVMILLTLVVSHATYKSWTYFKGRT